MNGTQSGITIEHIQVLKTLHDCGNITRQQMKSIRGQIITMRPKDREEYLKKIIKRSRDRIGGHDEQEEPAANQRPCNSADRV